MLVDPTYQQKLKSFNVIHPSLFVRTRMSLIRTCGGKGSSDLIKRVVMYDTLASYLESIKDDPTLSQRIIGVLPNDIHQMYVQEKHQLLHKKKTK